MKPVAGEVKGRAFFPGGKGTFDDSSIISDKPIMVVGQDFDVEANFSKAEAAGQENIKQNPTWRNLLALLEEVRISPQSCFFTNAIMGVRVDLSPGSQNKQKNTGDSPAFKHPDFIIECQDFFLKQLEMQRPRLILVLGKMPAKFLATMVEDLRPWKQLQTITEIDNAGQQLMCDATFSNDVKTTLVLLTHPSFRHLNIQKRRYKNNLTGAEAELEMLKDALKTINAA
ncbi:uracil-DNA glycosylase family protein [Hymenobacter perfusus]|nr:uracil-DNA glycosylase family protein [Hymenobacter perfusus]